MTKKEFLEDLGQRLSGLSESERSERLCFYEEMIDDKMEEGLSEEDAVFSIGSVDDIAPEISATKENKGKIRTKKKLSTWEIVLLAVGSPIWVALAASVLAVIISVYASMWAIVISLWACFGAFIGGSVGALAFVVGSFIKGDIALGAALIGIALVLAGLAILIFIGNAKLTDLTVKIPKMIVGCIKKCKKDKGEEK